MLSHSFLCNVFVYIFGTAQKMKFSIKDFFSKCDQIPRKLKKSLTEKLTFCAVLIICFICKNSVIVNARSYQSFTLEKFIKFVIKSTI